MRAGSEGAACKACALAKSILHRTAHRGVAHWQAPSCACSPLATVRAASSHIGKVHLVHGSMHTV
eukprot:9448738-Alexandrium_andersonii.AAC.1